MPTIVATTSFNDVPAGSFFEVWVEKNDAGALQCDFTFSNLDPATPDQRWFNPTLLRTGANPAAKGRAQISGPVACVLFAIIEVTADHTTGRVVLRAVDGGDNEIRRRIWPLGKGDDAVDPLDNGDDLNGIHNIFLA